MDRKNALYVNEVLTGTNASTSTLILLGSYAIVHAVVVALSPDLGIRFDLGMGAK